MSTAHQYFYFSASTQFSNAGDALINRELLALLREHGTLLVATAGAPTAFLAEIQVREDEAAFKGKWGLMRSLIGRALFKSRDERQYLVLTPGDPPGGISVGDFVRAMLFPLLKLTGVRIIKIGASVSRMDGRRLKLESWLSRWMHFYGIRDNGSVARAGKYQLKNFAYCPDLAFNHKVEAARSQNDSILVSLREDNLVPDEIGKLHARTREVVSALGGDGAIEKTSFISQVERDAEPMRALSAAWRGTSAHARHVAHIPDLEAHYAATRFVVSNRLHVILLAASKGAIPFCVPTTGKNRKITDLLESVGLGSLVLDHSGPLPDISVVQSAITQTFSEQRALLHDIIAREIGA